MLLPVPAFIQVITHSSKMELLAACKWQIFLTRLK